MNRSAFTWRIYWCVGVFVVVFARAWFGDPAHPDAAGRSLLFTAVWASPLLAYVCIMYLRPHERAGADYVVLVGCLVVIAFEVLWPTAALHNSHAGVLAGPLAGARLGTLWAEIRRLRAQSTAIAS